MVERKLMDWHDDMTIRQSMVVKNFQDKGWVIQDINTKGEVVLTNDNVEDKYVKRTARISRTPY